VGLLGSRKETYYGIISDGIHAHPNSVRIAYRSHPKGAVLVTDAMSAMGLGDGLYKLGDQEVRIQDNRATVNNSSTLAGSIATMDSCVRNFQHFTGCTKVQAIEAATKTPAAVLGLSSRKGRLAVGCDADMIILDEELRVKATFVGGELAWKAASFNLPCILNGN